MNERRAFFQSVFGKLLNEVAKRKEERVAPKRWFRPPGAAPEVAFVAACDRNGKHPCLPKALLLKHMSVVQPWYVRDGGPFF